VERRAPSSPTEYEINHFLFWSCHAQCNSQNKCNTVAFEVLMAVHTKSTVFWNVTPCSLVEVHYFARMYCHHLQGQRISQAKSMQNLLAACFWLAALLTLQL
jgi:hypothetical protein